LTPFSIANPSDKPFCGKETRIFGENGDWAKEECVVKTPIDELSPFLSIVIVDDLLGIFAPLMQTA
jgi:hypothetical protein